MSTVSERCENKDLLVEAEVGDYVIAALEDDKPPVRVRIANKHELVERKGSFLYVAYDAGTEHCFGSAIIESVCPKEG
jgi:hypothetical protein